MPTRVRRPFKTAEAMKPLIQHIRQGKRIITIAASYTPANAKMANTVVNSISYGATIYNKDDDTPCWVKKAHTITAVKRFNKKPVIMTKVGKKFENKNALMRWIRKQLANHGCKAEKKEE